MPLSRYKKTPNGIEPAPSVTETSVLIRRILERFDKEWPPEIEVAFWRHRGHCELVVIGDLRDKSPLELHAEKRRSTEITDRIYALRDHPRRLIRLKRLELCMTQSDLARKTGLNRSYLSRIESGIQRPGLGAVTKLSEALKVPPAYLIEDAQFEQYLTPLEEGE